jgi:hypothetical protein
MTKLVPFLTHTNTQQPPLWNACCIYQIVSSALETYLYYQHVHYIVLQTKEDAEEDSWALHKCNSRRMEINAIRRASNFVLLTNITWMMNSRRMTWVEDEACMRKSDEEVKYKGLW